MIPDSAAPSLTVSRWLWVVVAIAAALRFFPIWFGLPHPYTRPDEEVAIGKAMAMLQGDPNPHFFHWPSLIFYAFAALFTAASWIRSVLQLDPQLPQIEQILIARGFVAAAGTATVVALYCLGRRVAGQTTGLVAAAFLAVAVLHVRDSHFAMTDVLMTLLVTISLALLARAYEAAAASLDADSLRLCAAAGFTGGLAASTKYSAGAVVAAMAVAQLLLWSERREGTRSAWLPSLAFLPALALGFIVATPYALLDFPTFSADLLFDFAHLSKGHEGVDLGPGWIYHLTHSLPRGAGVLVLLAAITGALVMLRRHRHHALILGGFIAVFYGVFGSGQTVFFRYVLPLVPLICLMAAVAVRYAAPWVASHTGLSLRTSLVLLVVLAGGPGLANSVWLDILMARTDTRVLAAGWLEANIPPGETVYDSGSQYTRLRRGANAGVSADGATADWLIVHDSPVSAYTGTTPAIRTLASEAFDLVHTVHAASGRGGTAVYDLQDAFFLPVSGFITIERPGPTILIYRRRQSPPDGQ